jgi:phosphohistidine phosphatase
MDLILWRHAEAADGFPDSARPLTDKGRKQAKTTGAWFRKRLPEEVRILVSPTVRTRETADGLNLRYEVTDSVRPGATAAGILEAVGWPEGNGTVVVVGHQPVLGQVAAVVLTGEVYPINIRKGAVWWFRGGKAEGTVLKLVHPAES